MRVASQIGTISGRNIADIVQIALEKKAEQELNGLIVGPVTEEDIIQASQDSGKVREAKQKREEVERRRLGFRSSRDED